jgi:hypothetical protein
LWHAHNTVKSKHSSLCEYHEGIWGTQGIAPLILNLGTRWEWTVNSTPWLFYTWEKVLGYPSNRRLGGPQRQSG